jgi:hypothetical protein
MKRMIPIVLGVLAVSAGAFAQDLDSALAAAPPQAKDAATVIKWKPDYTYDTLRKGTNNMVCYDISGYPTHQPSRIRMPGRRHSTTRKRTEPV